MRLGDLDALKDYIIELMLVYKGTRLEDAIINAIDNAPPVERQRGKWKLSKRSNFIDIVCPYCNNVRFPQYAYGFSIEEVKEHLKSEKLPDYCESCGADMRGKEE